MIVCKLLFLLGIFLPFISGRRVPFFRRDYTYNEDFDAFYKVHWDVNGMTWNSAFLACDDEEATLFYPRVEGELNLVKELINDLKELPNVTEIFIGIHDLYRLEDYLTVDGHPTPFPLTVEASDSYPLPEDNCILMHIETGTYKKGSCESYWPLPFICKKTEIEPCPTVDRDYKYVNATRKCYKVNERTRVWDEAMRTCYLQGGILTVIESEEEADILRNYLRVQQRYHVGFRRNFLVDDFYTVKGQKYDEVYHRDHENNGYNNYREDEISRLDKECGAVFNNGVLYTTTHDCNHTSLPFICEMQANI